MSASELENFNRRRERLSEVLREVVGAIETLGVESRVTQLREARAQLDSETFRIMIVGEFKRGKSTTINALLGQDILPAKVAPCTSVITEVKYAEIPRARLHYSDTARSPSDIDPKDLRKYVVIQDGEGDDDNAESEIRSSPYALVELFHPLKLCKDRVEVVDSPGLNEHKTRQRVALEYLSRADALVLVLSCDQALSESELRFIDTELGGRNLRHVFFLWNRFDLIEDSPDDIEDIRRRSRKYLLPRAGTEDRIFYISSRAALVARKKGDDVALTKSRLPQFEVALEQFLGSERGRVKLSTPLRAVEHAVLEALRQTIPSREALLLQPLEELQRRYEQAQPRLADVERKRERMLASVTRHRDRLIQDSMTSYRNVISEIESAIPQLVARIEVGWWDAVAHKADSRKRIGQAVQEALELQLATWRDQRLPEIVSRHMSELQQDLDGQADTFLKDVEALRSSFTPEISFSGTVDPAIAVSPMSRLMGAVGGLVVGGVGSAIEGATMGSHAMVKGLGVNLAVGVGLVVMGFGAPVIVPVLAAIGFWKTISGGKTTAEQLRAAVTAEAVAQMRARLPDVERGLAEHFTVEIAKLYNAVDESTRITIDQVAGQVQAVLKDKLSGEQAARNERIRLHSVRETLGKASGVLEALRAEIED